MIARYKEYQRECAYRYYITDCLKIIAENTAKSVGGITIKDRYRDLLKPKKEDNRTPEEIVNDVIKRAGIEVKF